MKGLIVAIQFLTRLPTPRIAATDASFARSMRWFPAVGLILGLFIAAAAWLGCRLDSWTGALLALLAWTLLTGALHLDGLGDIADAAGAAHKGKDGAHLRAVLADPYVGSFAVVAIVTQLLAKLVLLHALLDRTLFLPVILIPFAARIGPLVWTRTLPPLHDGLGSRFRHVVRTVDLLVWSLYLIAAACFMPALLATPLLLPLWGLWLRRCIGGISGDGHGAGIELMESGLLLASLLWAALP
ncbi:adenosylcobinamide-GDP ribazoletransferase [Sphingobium sp. CCH11-B1]|jgi:adenosylcobinamide-GDP ribazoletransferase|uniref:adenosylcobinamide-GDP ribazoletransferase n=1 Tax=Sphingobium sp. CCH11-B1 TaxID=1768781 RepID=UPI00082A2765|nr:adenosylcobinamide-GDP ribazoletransferase [Sphingobium sp. CCH11-B1]MEA3389878.1 adenosylcobinamide-GDP ribazoletransferase [Pseudomonadota bacterium]